MLLRDAILPLLVLTTVQQDTWVGSPNLSVGAAPLLFWRKGWNAVTGAAPASAADVAPTLATMLGAPTAKVGSLSRKKLRPWSL